MWLDSPDEAGILLAPYGSASPRAMATYERILASYRRSFPGMPILLAFTSGLMIKRLEEREGIAVLSIEEGLEQLSGLGCIQAVAQSLHIVPGGEFHRLVSQARGYKLKEADREERLRISIGLPLLSGLEDCLRLSGALPPLWNEPPRGEEEDAVLLAGHGTGHPADALYSQMAQVLRRDHGRVLLGAIEGFPGIEEMIEELKACGAEKIRLRPFLLVAGGHAENDIAGPGRDSWKSTLEREGFEVDVRLKALGEMDGVVALLQEHTRRALESMKRGCLNPAPGI
ncbi:MAG TPA: sirohydrochlorin cobaltochelatase [Methanothrix sp.]|uniref:sirohydrochlorin cobaltochelatase n=4 Tax=Methanothrix sp. TaxID=90426 RepID=UPI002C9F644B|nr:sirohydrochlorin cobaltochelatase [Methanothrix sp.]MDI9417599.1 sirohydrochlorin cobaltochelatase [Euryarchaeota archaeon]HON36302.1 sirohydrochlorin cobaltochelatase [Methanothrix sp.]HRU75317.1 sirohydrochlorin cobaltochelatase [Methanothrix sp.]